MSNEKQPNQAVFYRHFKNLRRQYQETKLQNTSILQKSSQPDWDGRTIKNQKKEVADLCDIGKICRAVGSVSAVTLPLFKNFGPALNRLPKFSQRLRQYEISDRETSEGFEKTNRFQSGKFSSALYFTGQVPPGTVSETMTVRAKGCPTTVITEEEAQESEQAKEGSTK